MTWVGPHVANYLASGAMPRRLGTENPGIAPYKAYEASDGWLIIAAGTKLSLDDGTTLEVVEASSRQVRLVRLIPRVVSVPPVAHAPPAKKTTASRAA